MRTVPWIKISSISSGGMYACFMLFYLPFRKRQYRAVFDTTWHIDYNRTRKYIVKQVIIFWHICWIYVRRRFEYCSTWHPMDLPHSLWLLTMLEIMRRRTSDLIIRIGRSLHWFTTVMLLAFRSRSQQLYFALRLSVTTIRSMQRNTCPCMDSRKV